ncbi:MAG: tryptophan synthase subunit alpha [Proteobacteria bacterium]|nr:tryptophan synthase subunit alpha [Pseudomonadota bacterium]
MSLLDEKFTSLNGKTALIPFITAGHPKAELTVSAMHALVKNGADILELGMPFSDPMADGAVIQLSSEIAIQNGVGLLDVLEMVREFRSTNSKTPVILMGYLNPIEYIGYEKFVDKASKAGVNAVLLVDCPPEESEKLLLLLQAKNMQQIFLIAPTTTNKRIKYISQFAAGFIYYVALKGVTGSADIDTELINKDILAIRKQSRLPIAVGFGIKDAPTAKQVAKNADAVVIGSALVSAIAPCQTSNEIEKAIDDFISPIRMALDSL